MSHRASPVPASASASTTATSTAINAVPVTARSVKHSLFNPPRRRFAVPFTPHDPEMHQAVAHALKYHYQQQQQQLQLKRKQEQSQTEDVSESHPDKDSGDLRPQEPEKSAAEILWEKRLEVMEHQWLLEKEGLERAQNEVKKAQEHLTHLMQERNQKRQDIRQERETERQALESFTQQRAVLMDQIHATKDAIQGLELKRKQYIEEKKRKAIQDMEIERATKRVKMDESSTTSASLEPLSQVKRLEQTLQEKREQLNQLEQVRTGVIWLMKQVILVDMKNKKREVE